MTRWLILLLAVLALLPADVFAQASGGIQALKVTTNPDGSQDYTMTLQALAIMTSLSMIPAFVLMMSSFTRIIIVLSILRQAIGLQQSPTDINRGSAVSFHVYYGTGV